jgi:hypothetical protein
MRAAYGVLVNLAAIPAKIQDDAEAAQEAAVVDWVDQPTRRL